MVNEWPAEPINRTGSSNAKTRENSGRKSSKSAGVSEDGSVLGTLNALKILVRTQRLNYVKGQLEKNFQNLQRQLLEIERLSRGRDEQTSSAEVADGDGTFAGNNGSLFVRSQMVLFRGGSQAFGLGKGPQICAKLMVGNFEARKIMSTDIAKLELVTRIPSYTAWMFVDRNERMAKDQSIARRRRISYESNGKETFFCLDEEEDGIPEVEETKEIYGFSEAEEFILRMAIVEHGTGRGILQSIADFLHVSVEKVESRFQSLPTEGPVSKVSSWLPASIHSVSHSFRRSVYSSLRRLDHFQNALGKEDGVNETFPSRTQQTGFADVTDHDDEVNRSTTTLAVALDSFDTLFCRRCLVFNCALHSCFEEMVGGMNERQPPWVVAELDQPKPCSPGCRFVSTFSRSANTPVACSSGYDCHRSVSNFSDALEGWQIGPGGGGILDNDVHAKKGTLRTAANIQDPVDEKVCESPAPEADLKFGASSTISNAGGSLIAKNATRVEHKYVNLDEATMGDVKEAKTSYHSVFYNLEVCKSASPPEEPVPHYDKELGRDANGEDASQPCISDLSVQQTGWTRLEMDLCEKGMQIFGKNSCLIARNILWGLKSCLQIAEYISRIAAADVEEISSAQSSSVLGNMTTVNLHTRPVFRRKSRFGRKKAVPKSAFGAIRKRIGRDVGVLNLCLQYAPCSCESGVGCGENCPCMLADIHCEKYCGCFKVCKNRFRGCQCAKSMCDRRHCPCFSAGRECDPDVCKFCWVECGHSSSQACHNMRILQRKKKRLLLAHSDVCMGWGVFTRQALQKNDYIGEYTGELISHNEADRRGRIYDRETSFLFNLNDKLVVDAFRKGNKLKFANHSASKPNCYAKVLLVGGDHRVGIFAKENIEVGEELLYDYQYEPEIAPVWATGPN